MTREQAVAVLLADYRAKVEQLAEELRRWPVPGPGERSRQGDAFELRCQEVLCSTALDAGLAIALSENAAQAEPWDFFDQRVGAAFAVALDVAEIANVEWFQRRYEEVAA